MKFEAVCPACGGTGGGLCSFTVGLPPVEALKQMEDNHKRRCYLCLGRGRVTATTDGNIDENPSQPLTFNVGSPIAT